MAQFEKGFRHKTVKHFKVGPFIFKDSLLVIKSDDEDDFNKQMAQFEKLWHGLHPADRNAIRALKSVSNEEDVDVGVRKSLAVRGTVDTAKIADRPADDRLTAGGDSAALNQDGSTPNPTGAVTAPAKTLAAFKIGG